MMRYAVTEGSRCFKLLPAKNENEEFRAFDLRFELLNCLVPSACDKNNNSFFSITIKRNTNIYIYTRLYEYILVYKAYKSIL